MARIIIMEDDPDEGVLLSQLLERVGHEVMVFPDAQSTLDHLEVSGADVLLSDIFVKKENRLVPDGGVRLISTIRQLWRVDWTRLPIIAISGGVSIQGGASPLRIARDLGADALFEKPVPIDELHLTIEELVSNRLNPFRGRNNTSSRVSKRPSGLMG
ncbi:response regulator [Amaricoccus macauensis]|uniref:response regulator n=1 Tax=Amaricoccus macauensis TaxID=57001 RepID=UPI003C7A2874